MTLVNNGPFYKEAKSPRLLPKTHCCGVRYPGPNPEIRFVVVGYSVFLRSTRRIEMYGKRKNNSTHILTNAMPQ